MRKIFALSLALSLTLSLAACSAGGGQAAPGGNNPASSTDQSQQQTPDAAQNAGTAPQGADNGDLTANNWQQIITEKYDFELTVPAGWTFKQGEKQTTASYSLQFTTEAADFKPEYEAFAQYIFDLTAAIDPAKNNHDGDFESGYKGDKISEIPTMMGEILLPIWLFDTSKYIIQLDIMDSESTKTVQIYLVAVTDAD